MSSVPASASTTGVPFALISPRTMAAAMRLSTALARQKAHDLVDVGHAPRLRDCRPARSVRQPRRELVPRPVAFVTIFLQARQERPADVAQAANARPCPPAPRDAPRHPRRVPGGAGARLPPPRAAAASTSHRPACSSRPTRRCSPASPSSSRFGCRAPTRWFDAEGTIARVVHGRRPGDSGRCLGLEFDELDPEAKWLLARALRDVPPPVPRRERRVDYAASVHLAALSYPAHARKRGGAFTRPCGPRSSGNRSSSRDTGAGGPA